MSGVEHNRFGKYHLLQRIATGGMGEVHLAKLKGPSGFEKLVVIKRLLEARQSKKNYIDMFFSEARVAAQLNHSNIVQIYEVGEIDGIHYIAMEYVQGKSFRRILDAAQDRYGFFPVAFSVEIISELCMGLAFAHDARHLSGAPMGLIHRDINPLNVLVSYNGEVKVIDFGIAKSELTLEQTQAGTIKGTVVYMSPEQASGKKLDKRSDQFSVGICLYEALTGLNPFYKDNIALSLEAIRSSTFPALQTNRPELLAFSGVINKALSRSPQDRFADCAELSRALHELVDRGVVSRSPVSLSAYLQNLFEQDMADEERLLSQTELAYIPTAPADADPGALDALQTQVSAPPADALQPLGEEEETLHGVEADDQVTQSHDLLAHSAKVALPHVSASLAAASSSSPSSTFSSSLSASSSSSPNSAAASAAAAAGAAADAEAPSLLTKEALMQRAEAAWRAAQAQSLRLWARLQPLLARGWAELRAQEPAVRHYASKRAVQYCALGAAVLLSYVIFWRLFAPSERPAEPAQAAQTEHPQQADPAPGAALPSSTQRAAGRAPRHAAGGAGAEEAGAGAITGAAAGAGPAEAVSGADAAAGADPDTAAARAPGASESSSSHTADPTAADRPTDSEARKATNHRLPAAAPAPGTRRGRIHRLDTPALGTLQLLLEPAVSTSLNGTPVAGGVVRLRSPAGLLQIGTGSSREADPFVVRLRYRLENRQIIYALDATPWANVSGPGGMGLGRTPVQGIVGSGATVFELHNPHQQTTQRITIRFGMP